jgi:hypothetical protein
MAYLTSRTQASSVACNDILHIVKTSDTSQGNPAGSSYKASVSQLFQCCVNDFYVKNIHGCNTGDLFVQPLDEGDIFFGENTAEDGFTIKLDVGTAGRTRLGLHENNPAFTFDFYSKFGDARFFWADDYTSTIFNSWVQLAYSGTSSSFVTNHLYVDGGDGEGTRSIGLFMRGTNNNNSIAAEMCDPGDSALASSARAVNLNIVKRPDATVGENPDSIRFYAGLLVDDDNPHMIIRGRTMTDSIEGTTTNQGYVGINTTAPSQRLDVGGNARFRLISTIAGSFSLHVTSTGVLTTTASDVRLKENISTIENALNTVTSLRGVNYSWKDDETSKNRLGFIAQEVEQVNPDLMFTNETTEDKIKGVHYDMVGPLLVEAVKELDQKTSFIEYTPTSVNDEFGVKGQRTYDDNFMYIKTGSGWKKLPLMDI